MNSPDPFRKIALGTAQFGLSYGIANREGQVKRNEVAAILELAAGQGITMLDTAVAYGESEQVIGDVGAGQWQVVSKLPALPTDCDDVAGWVLDQLAGTLRRLRVDRLHGLLLHRPGQLLERNGVALYEALCALRARGVVEKIGISVYEPFELEQLFARMSFDIVQAPFSIIDDRLIESGWVGRLQSLGCELHVRSVFLQGLLLMETKSRPRQFDRWQSLWLEWECWLRDCGLSPLAACLRHALSTPGVSKLVVGVDSTLQLRQILEAAIGSLPPIPQTLKSNDPDLLNPARWVTA